MCGVGAVTRAGRTLHCAADHSARPRCSARLRLLRWQSRWRRVSRSRLMHSIRGHARRRRWWETGQRRDPRRIPVIPVRRRHRLARARRKREWSSRLRIRRLPASLSMPEAASRTAVAHWSTLPMSTAWCSPTGTSSATLRTMFRCSFPMAFARRRGWRSTTRTGTWPRWRSGVRQSNPCSLPPKRRDRATRFQSPATDRATIAWGMGDVLNSFHRARTFPLK